MAVQPPGSGPSPGLFLRWSDADNEGRAAYDGGKPIPPYPEGDTRRYLWLRGWFHRERELRANATPTGDPRIAPAADAMPSDTTTKT